MGGKMGGVIKLSDNEKGALVRKSKVHPIVWLNYFPRVSGHVMAAAILVSVLIKYNPPTWIYVYLLVQALIWPHVALIVSYNSKKPKKLESYLIKVDYLLTGCWIAGLGYEPWVFTVLLSTLLMASMSINGVRAYVVAIIYSIIGAVLTSSLYDFYFQPESSLITIFLSVFGIFVFTALISYLTFERSSELRRIRKEQDQLNDRLTRMNELIKTASMSLKLSEMVEKIYPEAKGLLGFDSYFILKFQSNSDILKIDRFASEDIPSSSIHSLLALETRPITEPSFAAEVIQSREMVYINNIDGVSQLSPFDEQWHKIAPYKSMFLVPILNENQVSGVIAFQRHKEGFDFDEQEMVEVNRYADQMSLMFNNALLYDESRTAQEMVKRKNENLEHANEEIQLQRDEVIKARDEMEKSIEQLKATQSQLVQQEKLASLGQLTAGIAHEIKHPLNFVNNFSELSIELIDDTHEEVNRLPDSEEKTNIIEILEDVKSNLIKIHTHGSRADNIVKSMLLHSRSSKGIFEKVELNELVSEYVNLAFHGMRANRNPISVSIEYEFDPNVGNFALIIEDFSRVILNLCQNAFDAMRDRLATDEDYKPKLTIRTSNLEHGIRIIVEDNGKGIPPEIIDKILDPFFTTKQGNEGTGLGLSISTDIIKAHGGTLKIESEENSFTRFNIDLKKEQT